MYESPLQFSAHVALCAAASQNKVAAPVKRVKVRPAQNPRLFRCEQVGCGMRFTRWTNLKRHMLTHTGEKPYPCTVEGCGKRFSQLGNLHTHMYTHTGERPYQCTKCPKAYNQSTALKRHMRSHDIANTRGGGVEPRFQCPECRRHFSSSSSLAVHLKQHATLFKCQQCRIDFSTYSDYHLHLRLHLCAGGDHPTFLPTSPPYTTPSSRPLSTSSSSPSTSPLVTSSEVQMMTSPPDTQLMKSSPVMSTVMRTASPRQPTTSLLPGLTVPFNHHHHQQLHMDNTARPQLPPTAYTTDNTVTVTLATSGERKPTATTTGGEQNSVTMATTSGERKPAFPVSGGGVAPAPPPTTTGPLVSPIPIYPPQRRRRRHRGSSFVSPPTTSTDHVLQQQGDFPTVGEFPTVEDFPTVGNSYLALSSLMVLSNLLATTNAAAMFNLTS